MENEKPTQNEKPKQDLIKEANLLIDRAEEILHNIVDSIKNKK